MNIVFAFADDFGRYASYYQKFEQSTTIHSVLHTPNFDRIAKEGAVFKNSHVPAPTCTPCRSSVLSGKYFFQTGLGAILNGAYWDESIPTYPLELEKNGFHIGYTYKVWAPGENVNAPYGGKRTQYFVGDMGDETPKDPNNFRRFGKFGRFSQNATKLSEQMSIEAAKECIYQETRDSFQSFLNARKENQPFAYWWGPVNTHRGWQAGSGKNLWGLNPDDLKDKLPKSLPDTPEIREDFCDYLGECQAFDAGIGILIEELEKIGELDNTLFVVSGDHGIPGMPHGKCNLYDLGTQVTLAMRWPDKIKPGQEIDEMVNLMDLAPTFLDAANVTIPDSMVGNSLLPLICEDAKVNDACPRDFVILGRERHVATAREGNLPYPQRAIRTKGFLYVVNFEPDRWPVGNPGALETSESITYQDLLNNSRVAYADMDASPTKAWICWNRKEPFVNPFYHAAFDKRPREELYDINLDPNNTINLANDETYQTVKEQLHKKLFEVLKEQNDPRVVQQNCCFELPPYTTRM